MLAIVSPAHKFAMFAVALTHFSLRSEAIPGRLAQERLAKPPPRFGGEGPHNAVPHEIGVGWGKYTAPPLRHIGDIRAEIVKKVAHPGGFEPPTS